MLEVHVMGPTKDVGAAEVTGKEREGGRSVGETEPLLPMNETETRGMESGATSHRISSPKHIQTEYGGIGVIRSRSRQGSRSSVGSVISQYDGDSTELRDGNPGCIRRCAGAICQPSEDKGTSWVTAVFLIVNAALGGGLLEFPYAYSRAGGVVAAVIVQAALIVFILGALFVLAYCAEVEQAPSYQGVVLSMCGTKWESVCSVCIALYCYGTCITFLTIIGDQFGQFFLAVYGPEFCHRWYMNRMFTISLCSVIIILPMCFPKRIDFLKYPSIVGVVAIVYVVALITVKYFLGVEGPRGPIKTSPASAMDLFIVVPTICFSYQCHVSVVPIYACLERRTVGNFSRSAVTAVLVCVCAYTGAAAFGYYTFGDGFTKPDILQSYKPTPDVIVGVMMILLKCIVTYPILTYCGRIAVADLYTQLRSIPSYEIVMYEPPRRAVITVVWFATSLVAALFVPNIAVVIDLLGGLAAMFIFVFPGMCLLRLTYDYVELSPLKQILYGAVGTVFIVFGVFIFGVVTTQSIMADISPSVDEPVAPVCT